MNTVKLILTGLILVICSGPAYSQESDYQVVESYKTEYSELENEITSTNNESNLDSLKQDLSIFIQEYQSNSALLDNALYPDSYKKQIDKLRKNFELTQTRVLLLNNQDEIISDLKSELQSYRKEINRYSQTTDSLKNLITSYKRSEKDLRSLVTKYRENLKRRDEFIITVMDSLLATQQIWSDSTEVVKEQGSIMLMGENPVTIITNIAEENLAVLKSNPDLLSVEDYLRIYTLQSKAEVLWESMGDDLIDLYAQNNGSNIKKQINDTLYQWKSSASRNMWRSIKAYINTQELDMEAFDDNESFYLALDSYIQKAKEESDGPIISDKKFHEFEEFQEFWSVKIKDDWNPYVQQGGLLTVSQINNLDREMISWRDQVVPDSIWVPFFAGILILSVVVLIVLYIRK